MGGKSCETGYRGYLPCLSNDFYPMRVVYNINSNFITLLYGMKNWLAFSTNIGTCLVTGSIPLPFSLWIESTSYVLSFPMVFFYLA